MDFRLQGHPGSEDKGRCSSKPASHLALLPRGLLHHHLHHSGQCDQEKIHCGERLGKTLCACRSWCTSGERSTLFCNP